MLNFNGRTTGRRPTQNPTWLCGGCNLRTLKLNKCIDTNSNIYEKV